MDVKLNLKNAIISGTAVVRKADGTIRYDDDATPGDFHESEADLKRAKDGADISDSS